MAVKKASETIVKAATPVTIGEETIKIVDFTFAKTVLATEFLAELAESVGLEDVFSAANAANANGEFNAPIATTFVQKFVEVLPKLIRNGAPALFKFIGLCAISNGDLLRLDNEGEDIHAALLARGKELSYVGTNEEIFQLLAIGVNKVGVQTILGNLTGLLSALR